MLSKSRKAEIRKTIDDFLEGRDLKKFTLEKIKEEIGLFAIVRDEGVFPGCGAIVFPVKDYYFIGIESGRQATPLRIAHELGHIFLHFDANKRRFRRKEEILSGYQEWYRSAVKKQPIKKSSILGDTDKERAEADYFAKYWNERLNGIDWLRETTVEKIKGGLFVKPKKPKLYTVRLGLSDHVLGYKVLTPDMKSLGLRGNSNIIEYPIQEWVFLDTSCVREGKQDFGGIWVTKTLWRAKQLERYMKEKHGRETRTFSAALDKILYFNLYRIKTNGIHLLEKVN